MAVKDGVSYYPTERLISKTSRRHYRVPVRSQHWQLRSLISAEKLDTVYFPGGNGSNHVQRLDTTTNECETVRLLSFSPRCLVAQNGWVCCGGETGEFTAIRLHDDRLADERTELDLPLNDLEADARLPLSFESFRAAIYGSGSRTSRLQSTLEKNLVAKSQKLARDRVNCVTLWFPPENARMPKGHYSDPVAVLANNDKTVVLVGLNAFESEEKAEPLDVVVYPDYVNRSMMSPDGQLLISILDDPYLYVHRRVEKVDDQNSVRSQNAREFQWEECNKVLLKSQKRGDSSDSRGSFAACFSASGSYLAVGTQYGTISVFETRHLTNPSVDPLLTTFTSSRPLAGSGAVRDMAFCPGPFDLLAWTEDRGRVGVADVRSGFDQQQILDISAESEFEHVTVLDRNSIDPRLLEGRGERSDYLSSNQVSTTLASRDARRRRTAGEALGLSHDETLVLEALQIERRRREQTDRIAQRLADHGVSTASPSVGTLPWEREATRSSGTTDDDTSSRGPRARSSSVARALQELQRDRDERSNITRALTEWLRESRDRNQRTTPRSGDRTDRPRERESSAVVPPLPRRTTTLRPPSENTSQTPRSRSAGRGGLPGIVTAGGWADLEALYNVTLESNPNETRDPAQPESAPRNREGEREREGERDRDRSGFLPFINSVAIREMENRLAQRRQGIDHSVHESPPEPDNTAGISWSEDGRTLFVGAENGIYEFQVNTQGRKYCPNTTMR